MILTKTVRYRGKTINIDNLKNGSQISIEVQCPVCDEVRGTTYKRIMDNGHEYCRKCSMKMKRSKNTNIGDKFGLWEVIDNNIIESGVSTCICECGTIRLVDNTSLRSGASRSCGCLSAKINQSRRKFLQIGGKYGRLTVVNNSEKSGYSVCVCECGNIRTVSNSNLNGGIAQSCGCLRKENSAIALRKIRSMLKGENNPNWKGGISERRRLFMQTQEYKNWRISVFERDNYSCRRCGQTNKICAHHILNYAQHSELRTNIDNGITFCGDCHRLFHKLYGNKNNNFKQIEKYAIRTEE